MKSHGSAQVTDFDGDDYTLVRFKPDLKHFHLKTLTPDIISLFKKRVAASDPRFMIWQAS